MLVKVVWLYNNNNVVRVSLRSTFVTDPLKSTVLYIPSAGADLEIYEWWGCVIFARKARAKN